MTSPRSTQIERASWRPEDYSKLWHDDIRRPPDGTWFWARTNRDAVRYLLLSNCQEASLDHDLGLHEQNPDAPDAVLGRGGSPDGNGVDLVKAMVALNIVPPKVNIHSWNPAGAEYMAGMLQSLSGAVVTVQPYEMPHAA